MPRGNVHMTYYLCYGTPLMDRSIERQIEGLRLEGQGLLRGWRMDFSNNGKPNLKQDAGSQVWGNLYLIEESKLAELDKFEGGSQRVKVSALFEWEPEEAYVCVYPAQGGAADPEFVKALREIYRQASLPQAQIDQALGLAAAAK